MRPCMCNYWSNREIWPGQRYYRSHLLIWDGSTRKLWTQRPTKERPELISTVYIDQTPKVGKAFGMIIPANMAETLEAQYQASVDPMTFMADVIAAFKAAQYPGTFEMSALHVIGGLAFLYHLRTTSAYGRTATTVRFNATGVIVQDIRQEWFSDSFGQS